MQDKTNNPLTRLEDLDDYKIADGDPDVRGWKVKSADGQTAGKVEGLIVDTASMQVRYLDVELDRKALKLNEDRRVLLPIAEARLDDHKDEVLLGTVAATQLAALQPYRPDGPLPVSGPPPREDEARQFYGKRGGTGGVQRMTLSEEEMHVGKHQKQAGEVDVHKTVETRHVSEKVPLRHEEVDIERRAVQPGAADADGISEDEVRIPLMAEEAVVEKHPVAKEEVVIRKKMVEDEQTVEADLARERLDVDNGATGQGRQDRIAQQWPQIRDKVHAKWDRLTEQDLNVPEGDSRYLAGKLQERYGERPQQAQRHVQEFSRTL